MALKASFSVFKVKLQWLIDSADLLDRPEHVHRVAVRLLTANSELLSLEDSYQRIIELADPEKPLENQILEAARKEYVRALEAFDKLMIEKLKQNASATGAEESAEPKSEGNRYDSDALVSRLPTLQLPIFAGDMDQWVGFNNLFDSLVDSRMDLSPSQKLAYLMSCISGEARGLIQHIKISDAGYKTARDLLMRRYQNTRHLADVHVAQIMNLPNVPANLIGLRSQFLNPMIMATNSLERLGFPVADWSFLLLHIALTKLPASIKTRFEQKYGTETDVIPTFSELVEFLETECRMLECAKREHNVNNNIREDARAPPRRPQQHYAAAQVTCCPHCGDPSHSVLYRCSRFKALTPFARKDFVSRNRLCYFCLGSHEYRDCHQTPMCDGCGSRKHHRLLCFNRVGTEQPRVTGNDRRSPPRMDARVEYYQRGNGNRTQSPRSPPHPVRTPTPDRRRGNDEWHQRANNVGGYGQRTQRVSDGRRDQPRYDRDPPSPRSHNEQQ